MKTERFWDFLEFSLHTCTILSFGADLEGEAHLEPRPFRGLSLSSVQTPAAAGQQLSLWRGILMMAVAGDCSKCGFPVDEAAQVLHCIAEHH